MARVQVVVVFKMHDVKKGPTKLFPHLSVLSRILDYIVEPNL